MQLNISYGVELPANLLFEMNEIANHKKELFNESIGGFYLQYKNDYDWLFSTPAVRNPHISRLFYYFCILELLEKILPKQKLERIVVDTICMKKEVERILKKKGMQCPVILSLRYPILMSGKLSLILERWIEFWIPVIHTLMIFFFLKLFRKKKRGSVVKPNIIIDTMIIPGFVEEDRYFGDFIHYVKKYGRGQVAYTPVFTGFSWKEIPKTLLEVRKSSRNWLLKEDVISLRDLMRIFYRTWKYQLKNHSLVLGEIQFGQMVSEELFFKRGTYSVFQAHMNVCFFKRLRVLDYEIKRTLSWYEGQVLTRGWAIGLRDSYPDAESISYKGFGQCSQIISSLPQKYEIEAGVISKTIAVIGKYHFDVHKALYPNLDITLVPAFRFQSLLKFLPLHSSTTLGSILVILPIYEEEAIGILKMIDRVIKIDGLYSGVKINLKCHPGGLSKEILINRADFKGDKNVHWVVGDVYTCMQNIDIVVTNSSTTSFDAIVLGKSVIIKASSNGLTYNFIPENYDDRYKIISTEKELFDAICEFIKRPSGKVFEKEEVNQYFEPISDEACAKFLKGENNPNL